MGGWVGVTLWKRNTEFYRTGKSSSIGLTCVSRKSSNYSKIQKVFNHMSGLLVALLIVKLN